MLAIFLCVLESHDDSLLCTFRLEREKVIDLLSLQSLAESLQ